MNRREMFKWLGGAAVVTAGATVAADGTEAENTSPVVLSCLLRTPTAERMYLPGGRLVSVSGMPYAEYLNAVLAQGGTDVNGVEMRFDFEWIDSKHNAVGRDRGLFETFGSGYWVNVSFPDDGFGSYYMPYQELEPLTYGERVELGKRDGERLREHALTFIQKMKK